MTEQEWNEQQLSRGELAGAPETMPCYECFWQEDRKLNPDRKSIDINEIRPPERKVVRLGPVVNRADPTQTYDLECGHRAAAF